MALVKKRSNSARLFLVLVVVVAIAGVGYFLVQQFIAPSPGGPDDQANRNRAVITNFGEGILNDDRYRALRSFERTISVNVNADAGNPDPFQ
ncbi:MAG: hypothetical protein HYY50_01535 [Candidatus Kerfeldbacteria bacterium]|nr:hypothetical protein [Candidatus Kerfeldbacteria bacterium]